MYSEACNAVQVLMTLAQATEPTDELAELEQPVTGQDIKDIMFERGREYLWVGRPGLFIEVEGTDYETFEVEEA